MTSRSRCSMIACLLLATLVVTAAPTAADPPYTSLVLHDLHGRGRRRHAIPGVESRFAPHRRRHCRHGVFSLNNNVALANTNGADGIVSLPTAIWPSAANSQASCTR